MHHSPEFMGSPCKVYIDHPRIQLQWSQRILESHRFNIQKQLDQGAGACW